jgi:arabinosyltransferase A
VTSPSRAAATSGPAAPNALRLVAAIAGLVGLVLCLLTPLLPVRQHTATLDWPQLRPGASSANVTASLVAQAPETMTVRLPAVALRELATSGGTALTTVPTTSSEHDDLALSVTVSPPSRTAGQPESGQTVTVTSRSVVVAAAPLAALGETGSVTVTVGLRQVGVHFTGIVGEDGSTGADNRPVVAGIFTDLTPAQVAATHPSVIAHLDTRFQLSPSPIKAIAMVLGLACVLASLIALLLLDRAHHVRAGPQLPLLRRLRPKPVDVAAIGGLIVWSFLGAGSTDDGYILTMGKAASGAGYTANYYRFFGAPEAPFDWYYSLLSHWVAISPTALWTRLPALLAGIVSWLLLSRILLPRLGPAIKQYPLAGWAAAAMLLAVWLPMNSGLRSEPIIVLGTLVTWVFVERSLATHRVLPAALAALTAGLTFGLAPHGIVAAGLLLPSAAALLRVIMARRAESGVAALVLPILAAGAVIVPIAFRDQSLASVAEAVRIRIEVGPASPWTMEYLRYYFLTVTTSDGSLARRVPLYLLAVCLFVTLFVTLRRGHIRRIASGPVWRLIGAVFVGMALLTLTPTKWTVQLGSFAGFGAALAAVTTVAVAEAARHSLRNFAFFLTGLLFALAAAFSGYFNWVWPYSWGVPWFDRRPLVAGVSINSILLVLTVLAGAFAAWQHYRLDFRRRGEGGLADDAAAELDDADLARLDAATQRSARRGKLRLQLASAPLAVLLGGMVVFEVLAFAKAGFTGPNTYTVARGNVNALRGDRCGMATQVQVEQHPSDNLLTPADGQPAAAALTGPGSHGFTPAGIATDLKPQPIGAAPGQINVASPVMIPFASAATTSGTGGGTGPRTVNGSTAALPYGLDPARTPVVGSYGQNTVAAELFSDWYTLPPRSADRPLIAISAAGSIASVDQYGESTFGQPVTLEWAHRGADGRIGAHGAITPIDPGPNMPWRNLRVPIEQIPAQANVVRLHVLDGNLGAQQWVAVTPPRMPRLRSLQQVVGVTDPVLLDLLVGQQFPCQRPMAVRHGMWEIPKWRILPTRKDAIATSRTWQATEAGGPLTVPDTLLQTTTVPTYLKGDLWQDWGDLQQYTPLADAPQAGVTVGTVSRSGWWRPGPIRALTDQTQYTGH